VVNVRETCGGKERGGGEKRRGRWGYQLGFQLVRKEQHDESDLLERQRKESTRNEDERRFSKATRAHEIEGNIDGGKKDPYNTR